MNDHALAFLKELLATPTPSGSEYRGQGRIADYMRPFADEVREDVHGNVMGILNPGAPCRVMLAGHCDEIGLMVQHIDKKGMLYVSALGGVNVALLQGERILIHSAGGPVHGVIGVKPIHLMTPKEREAPVNQIHELWVDIGASSRKEAETCVQVGDVATIDTGWIELRGGRIACRGMDDRVGAFAVADTLRLLNERKRSPNVAIYAVATVQEEVGLRGSRTAAFDIDPHVGIAVDVGFATDYPGMNEKITGEAKLGGGPILHRGPTYNSVLLDRLHKAARKAKVATQMQPEPRGMSTDAYSIQMTRAGVAAGLVSIPLRYMHSPVETLSIEDVAAVSRLLAELVAGLRGNETWR